MFGQTVQHLESYLADEDDVRNVLGYYQKTLAELIHVQMQEHRWGKAAGYDVKVTRGFMALQKGTFTATGDVQDFRVPPANKNQISRLVFGGFRRCLYPVQKFQSDPERRLALILDRETEKWFKPALGQFQIYYPAGIEQKEYQPDFVAKTAERIYLLESKMSREMESADVLAKKDAGEHARKYGGKPWQYVLIPHDAIADNMTLAGLTAQYSETPVQ